MIYAVVLGLFVAGILAIAWMARNSTLEKLPALEGEVQRFELGGVEVYTRGAPNKSRMGRCVVRVTDRRLIVAQPNLIGGTHALRYVFHVPSRGETSLSGVYVTTHLQPEQIQLDEGAGEVRLPMGDSSLTVHQKVILQVSDMAPWRAWLAAAGGAESP